MVSDNSTDVVGVLMEEHNAIAALLPPQEVSLRVSMDAAFRKTLLLSAASYFEVRMSQAVIDVFSEETNRSEALVEFVRQKAVVRRYHDWFDWNKRNANKFLNSFGSGFGPFMEKWINEAGNPNESIRAFMEIGRLRNDLVHQNFALFPLEKTVDEIFEMYKKALSFVDAFPDGLREYLQQERNDTCPA